MNGYSTIPNLIAYFTLDNNPLQFTNRGTYVGRDGCLHHMIEMNDSFAQHSEHTEFQHSTFVDQMW